MGRIRPNQDEKRSLNMAAPTFLTAWGE